MKNVSPVSTATKHCLIIVLLPLIVCLCVSDTRSQTTAQDRADALRLQLEEVQTKQLDLQYRLQNLEEQLKPENIEKSLAGIGSTHPEDLRELRRRQLEPEKVSIQKQLNLLAESRTRLETGLAQAEADAYHQSAKGPAGNTTDVASPANYTQQPSKADSGSKPRRLRNNRMRPRRVRG
jgi:membrane protein involved in colicin uptake